MPHPWQTTLAGHRGALSLPRHVRSQIFRTVCQEISGSVKWMKVIQVRKCPPWLWILQCPLQNKYLLLLNMTLSLNLLLPTFSFAFAYMIDGFPWTHALCLLSTPSVSSQPFFSLLPKLPSSNTTLVMSCPEKGATLASLLPRNKPNTLVQMIKPLLFVLLLLLICPNSPQYCMIS